MLPEDNNIAAPLIKKHRRYKLIQAPLKNIVRNSQMSQVLVNNRYITLEPPLFWQPAGTPWELTPLHFWLTCFSFPTTMNIWIDW